mgnify:CR=1 FL=1
MLNYSIVIPCYNEFDNLLKLIPEIDKSLENYNNFEIIIINDCSQDNTKNIKNYLNIKVPLRLVSNITNRGQSFSIYEGVKNSKNDNIITIDGDCQNNPNDINKLINLYEKKSLDLIGGIRKKRKDSVNKKIGSYLANKIRKYILKDNCDDSACGLKIFKKNYFLKISYFSGLHRFLPALFSGMKCNLYFVEVDHRERNSGKSNYDNFTRFFYGLRDIFKVIMIIRRIKFD